MRYARLPKHKAGAELITSRDLQKTGGPWEETDAIFVAEFTIYILKL